METEEFSDIETEGEQEPQPDKPRRVIKRRRVKKVINREFNFDTILEIPGVAKVVLSSFTQETLSCIVGENITPEYPWKYVSQEELMDDIELKGEDSDFFTIKDKLAKLAGKEILLGFLPAENKDADEFYVCLTKLAETEVLKIRDTLMAEREERLKRALIKTIKDWKPLGSAKEVDQEILKTNRSLLEVEVESRYPIRVANSKFRLRLVQNSKNAYVEILSPRQTFINVYKIRLNTGVQVTPQTVATFTQTTLTYPENISTQYSYEYKEATKLSKQFKKNINRFIEDHLDELDDMLYVGGSINFYRNDYFSLITDEYSTQKNEASLVKECFSLYDQNVGKGKIIISLCWHPMWTGTVAIAYAEESLNVYTKLKSKSDVVLDAIYHVPPVLLWSFVDTLTAILYLETPRLVTAVSFCPYNENILIGGCINGQIIVWDITDRLRKIEEEEILTPAQQRYRTRMNGLMTWMKNTTNFKLVRPTVVSDLEYSHTSPVTSLRWISHYREVTRSGKIQNIPEDEERSSLQFMSSSLDGTVLTWDLKAKPRMAKGGWYRPRKRLRRLKRRPSALNVDVSPLRELHRLFKPVFSVNILVPNTSRNLPLADLSILTSQTDYVEKYPNPNRKYNILERRYYTPIFNRPTHPLVNKFIAGTVEGDFLVASWEGFEVNSGLIVNTETCKLENYGKYHDGPVVALSRSLVIPGLILTAGGTVFAVWHENFIGKPVLWRKSKYRYTHAVWNNYMPSMIRLSRADGCVEIWRLNIRSERHHTVRYMSGGILTGTYINPLSVNKLIIGVGDYTSALRVFSVQPVWRSYEEESGFLKKLIDREIDRKLKFVKWQEHWKTRNAAWLLEKQKRDLAIQKGKEEPDIQKQLPVAPEQPFDSKPPKPDPSSFSKIAEEKWKLREQKRMNAVLMQKKMLDMELLEKQQIPLLKLQADEVKLQQTRIQRLQKAEQMFVDAAAMLFPDAIEKKPPPTPDPYGGGDCLDDKLIHFSNYKEMEEECEATVKDKKFYYHFDWLAMKNTGNKRRKFLDGYYDRENHTARLVREMEEAAIRSTEAKWVAPVVQQTADSSELDLLTASTEET